MRQTHLTRLTAHLTRHHIPGWRLLHTLSITALYVRIYVHMIRTGERYHMD